MKIHWTWRYVNSKGVELEGLTLAEYESLSDEAKKIVKKQRVKVLR